MMVDLDVVRTCVACQCVYPNPCVYPAVSNQYVYPIVPMCLPEPICPPDRTNMSTRYLCEIQASYGNKSRSEYKLY